MSRNIFFAVLLSFVAIFISASTASGQLLGTYPSDGGPISITTTNGPVATSGLEFWSSSETGLLSAGGSPAPFAWLFDRSESSPPFRESMIGLEAKTYDTVVLDGTVTLDIFASRGVEVEAVWKRRFDVASTNTSPFLVTPNNTGRFANITGSYAYDGGPITIEPTDPEIPLRVSNLEINVEQGPGELTSGGSSAPFSSLSINTNRRWSATSDVPVEIDGPVTLDLELKPTGFDPIFALGKADTETGSGLFPIVRQEPKLDDRIRGSYSSQGPILIESTRGPITLRGLEFTNGGLGRTDLTDTPFETVHNDHGRWVLRSDREVLLDGELLLDAKMRKSSETAIAWDGQSSTRFPLTERSFHVDVSYPPDGGNLLIRSDVNQPSPYSIESIDIELWSGSLRSEGQNPSPFQTVTRESMNWTAVSESPIELPTNGWLELDVVASPRANGRATVSNGLDETTVAFTRIRPPATENLIGGYSMLGGPVSLASNAPVKLRKLRIDAVRGHLVGGGSPAPFESLTTNKPFAWEAESNAEVIIDGVVELDLKVGPGALLTGQAWNGETRNRVTFNGLPPSLIGNEEHDAFFVTYPEEGGNLFLVNPSTESSTIRSGGIEFLARPGILTAGTDPSPYAFFIPNSAAPGNVAIASLGTPPTAKGVLELDIAIVPNVTLDGDIVVSRGAHATDLPLVMMPSLKRFATSGNGMFCVIPANELVGDLDDDGTVQFSDFLTLAGNFGLTVNTYGEGDINCNGTVDFEDFIRLGGNFGKSRPVASQPVPEPTAAVLFVLGLFAFKRTQRPRRSN